MSITETLHHPGEIRVIQFEAIDAIGYEAYARELMSFLDTDTLRQFTEHLEDQDIHQFDTK